MEKSTYSFPRGPMTLGAAADEARRALAADYAADVNAVCALVKAKAKGLEPGQLGKLIETTVEKSQRVRVPLKAMWGFVSSKNADVAEDFVVPEDFEDGMPWEELAFFAMRQDVIDQLDADGVDVSQVEFDDEGAGIEETEDEDVEGDDD